MSVLAWFRLPAEESVEAFRAATAKYDAVFEGWGVDKRDGSVEGYVVFPNKKKMASCAKNVSRVHDYELVDYVT